MSFALDKPHSFHDLDPIVIEICEEYNDICEEHDQEVEVDWMERESSYYGWYNVIYNKKHEDQRYLMRLFVNNGNDASTPAYENVNKAAAIFSVSNQELRTFIRAKYATNPDFKLL